jgi:hypothetical protein
MNCFNCGASNVENFCGECGKSQSPAQTGYGFNQPIIFADTVATPPVKQKSNILNILIIVFLSIFTLSSVAYGINSNGEADRRAVLVAEAIQEVEEFTDLAESYESIYADSVRGRDQCYINWYCSASTYRQWIKLVNDAESGGISARSQAATWQATLASEQLARSEAETNRTIGFGLAGLFGVSLVVFIVLVVLRKGKRS